MTGNGEIRPTRCPRVAPALLGLLCALLLPGQASALSGSIRLDCHVQAGGETLPLAGDTYAIVQIADITVEGQGGAGDLTYQKGGFYRLRLQLGGPYRQRPAGKSPAAGSLCPGK